MNKLDTAVISVAVALTIAAVAGGILSRSLMGSSATRSRTTEARVLMLFNEQRVKRGLKPLAIDKRLTRAANSHSADMLRRGYFAHDGPQGKWDARIRQYVRRSLIGEILSMGSGPYATPKGMVGAWMRSSEHRRVILTPDLRRVGVGVATGVYEGREHVALATADFSSK